MNSLRGLEAIQELPTLAPEELRNAPRVDQIFEGEHPRGEQVLQAEKEALSFSCELAIEIHAGDDRRVSSPVEVEHVPRDLARHHVARFAFADVDGAILGMETEDEIEIAHVDRKGFDRRQEELRKACA